MKKFIAAISFAALALIGINAGIAQTNVQIADVKYDFPTNAQEDDVNLRTIADLKYDFPTNDQEDDVNLRTIADTRYDQRSAPDGGDDEPSMRLFSGSKA